MRNRKYKKRVWAFKNRKTGEVDFDASGELWPTKKQALKDSHKSIERVIRVEVREI